MDSSKIDKYEYYDHDKFEKIQEKRSYTWLKLYKKIMDAREKGDEKALAKAKEDMRNHEEQDQIIEAKARANGFY